MWNKTSYYSGILLLITYYVYTLSLHDALPISLKAQQYQILKAKAAKALGTSLLIIPELRVLVLTKRHVGSGNEIGENHSNI